MKSILLIFLVAILSKTFSQCPTTSFDLLTQADVNAFTSNYPGCTFIPDGIDIKISGSNINNLSPLAQLNGSDGIIEVRDCPLLTSLNGFNNLTRIGNNPLDGFILRNLPMLTDISALSGLDTLHGEFTIRGCSGLQNLNGLNNLVYVNGSVIIRDNSSLANLNGLDQLHYIGETLELVDNASLSDISSLQNVDSIIGGIEGGVFVEGNTALNSLNGLGNSSTHIGSNLDIILNGNLSMCSVPSICKYLANPPAGAIITINTNTVGCNTQNEIETACLTAGLEDINHSAQIFIMESNIVNEQIVIYSGKEGSIQFLDLLGHSYRFDLIQGKNQINISSLPNGVFFIAAPHGKMLKMIKQS